MNAYFEISLVWNKDQDTRRYHMHKGVCQLLRVFKSIHELDGYRGNRTLMFQLGQIFQEPSQCVRTTRGGMTYHTGVCPAVWPQKRK